MLIKQKIEETKLSVVQQQIASYILEHPYQIKNLSLKQLAMSTYTSSATVTRFVNKIGYKNYQEFKDSFYKEMDYLNTHFKKIDANFPFTKTDDIVSIASKVTTLAKEALDDTLALFEHDSLQQAVQLLVHSDTIHLHAISYPLLYGHEFRLNMMRLGRKVNIEPILGEEYFTTTLVSNKDCCIFISYSGAIEKLLILAKEMKAKKIPIIVISSIGDNHLKEYADIILHISTREKLVSKIGGFSNEYSIKLILDVLYSCLFAMDYERNLQMKVQISKLSEIGRTSSSEILKEE